MIYLAILILAFMLFANYAVAKNMLYPPALYTGVWLLTVLGLAICGDTFYPLSTGALMVFVTGVLAFSIGGLAVVGVEDLKRGNYISFTPKQIRRVRRTLDVVLLIVIIGLPFYYQSIATEVDLSHPQYFAKQREIAVRAAESSERELSLLKNMAILSLFLALAMHYENDRTFARRCRSYLAILVALLYGVLTGTKGGLVTLTLALSFLSSIRAGQINFFALGIVVFVALALFAVGLFFVNYGYDDMELSIETIELLVAGVRTYWFGGVVAFEDVFQSPNNLESVQHINRFFLETANGFGAKFIIPSIHAEYTRISQTEETNVYTIYFSYFKDYGWLGVTVALFLLGSILTWIYKSARRGNHLAMAFYSMTAVGLVLSIHAEHFVLALNLYIKMLFFFYVVYHGISRLSLPIVPLKQPSGPSA
jgi:oligosaccharide repeat unit polymerase